MMFTQKKKLILVIAFFIIFLSIFFALIIEYVLDYKPCNLCIYERIPYFISFILIIKIFFFKRYEKIIFLILFLVFIISAVLAFYHFGIEQGFFNESFVCDLKNSSNILSKELLLKDLSKNIVSCKDVKFKILGLSLASINTILSIILSLVFLKLFLNYGSNSTSQYK